MKSRAIVEAARAELARYGVRHTDIVHGKKHHRLVWRVGERECWVPVPFGTRNSPSAGKNIRKEVRKILEA
jgi:hypothetical protein